MAPVLYVPSVRTGETPIAWAGPEFGGREDFGLSDWKFSGGGLDAPNFSPAGSTLNCNFDEVPAPRTTDRDAAA